MEIQANVNIPARYVRGGWAERTPNQLNIAAFAVVWRCITNFVVDFNQPFWGNSIAKHSRFYGVHSVWLERTRLWVLPFDLILIPNATSLFEWVFCWLLVAVSVPWAPSRIASYFNERISATSTCCSQYNASFSEHRMGAVFFAPWGRRSMATPGMLVYNNSSSCWHAFEIRSTIYVRNIAFYA